MGYKVQHKQGHTSIPKGFDSPLLPSSTSFPTTLTTHSCVFSTSCSTLYAAPTTSPSSSARASPPASSKESKPPAARGRYSVLSSSHSPSYPSTSPDDLRERLAGLIDHIQLAYTTPRFQPPGAPPVQIKTYLIPHPPSPTLRAGRDTFSAHLSSASRKALYPFTHNPTKSAHRLKLPPAFPVARLSMAPSIQPPHEEDVPAHQPNDT